MTRGVVGQQIINALALGSVYAMIAVGLAMIYGVLRVLHIAHAGVYTAGAYLGLLFYNSLNNADYNVLLAYTLIGASLTVIGNLVADMALTVADPRIRLA